ncbi:MAG: putative peroxidase family protein [Blastococcus sp.]|nr:putative peroxidase family protein [Blastococcus sp.]
MTGAAGGALEPVLAAGDIQGDSLSGFRKDHQHYEFLKVGDVATAKRSLARLAPRLSPLADVHMFNRLFRHMRTRRGEIPGTLSSTWINVAFTSSGLAALTSQAEVAQFDDEAFKLGLAARAGKLGDPVDPQAEGHPARWVVGGPQTPVDAVVIVGSDSADNLATTVTDVVSLLTGTDGGFTTVWSEPCDVRADLPGHEHFGFRDGISQPGIRGRLSQDADSYLTPRYLEPADPRAARFSRPGQPLVWPGEFVLGLPRQQVPPADDLEPAPAVPPQPAWAADGSFLVIRRLRQDVAAFTGFIEQTAAQLSEQPGLEGLSPQRLAALIVGRWPSGAPLTRAPDADDPDLGADDFAANDFGYVSPWGQSGTSGPPELVTTRPLPHGVAPHDVHPRPVADAGGLLCPHGAHVRKINPRDQGTDLGGPRNTLRRRILRRGMPFGPQHATAPDASRGLMFACYQASIQDQFEFLSTNWVNRFSAPRADPGGADLLIAESAATARRTLILVDKSGKQHEVATLATWVTPTGGGYFFAPAISAVRDVLTAETPPS